MTPNRPNFVKEAIIATVLILTVAATQAAYQRGIGRTGRVPQIDCKPSSAGCTELTPPRDHQAR